MLRVRLLAWVGVAAVVGIASCSHDWDQLGGAGGAGGAAGAGGAGGAGGVPRDPCGDGHLDPGEECDDGNGQAHDGCTDCKVDCDEPGSIQDPDTHHCYWLSEQPHSWSSAEDGCRVDKHSDLAALSTQAEIDLVEPLVRDPATWIGGHWDGSNWTWTFGESWSYGDDQGSAMPPWNQMHGENHQFLQCVLAIGGGRIDAGNCEMWSFPAICERTP